MDSDSFDHDMGDLEMLAYRLMNEATMLQEINLNEVGYLRCRRTVLVEPTSHDLEDDGPVRNDPDSFDHDMGDLEVLAYRLMDEAAKQREWDFGTNEAGHYSAEDLFEWSRRRKILEMIAFGDEPLFEIRGEWPVDEAAKMLDEWRRELA